MTEPGSLAGDERAALVLQVDQLLQGPKMQFCGICAAHQRFALHDMSSTDHVSVLRTGFGLRHLSRAWPRRHGRQYDGEFIFLCRLVLRESGVPPFIGIFTMSLLRSICRLGQHCNQA